MELSLKHRIAKPVLEFAWLFLAPIKALSRAVYRFTLKFELVKDWRVRPNPEWFNHEFDFALFRERPFPHLFERGVYIQEVLKPGMRVLDICCGDGTLPACFIAPVASRVDAVDFDPDAIRHARDAHAHRENLTFHEADIRKFSPAAGSYDLVTWDAAIEHFTLEEMNGILRMLHSALTKDGILQGSTLRKGAHDEKLHHDHEHEFDSLDEMQTLLKQHFERVVVWERVHQDRTNFYFRCFKSAASGGAGFR